LNSKRGPLALIIIDGWGYSANREGNAIALAATPIYDKICELYPHTLLEASGERVGLPPAVMGNSEVGHLNIGAGRVIRMDVSRIGHEIQTADFFKNPALIKAMEGVRQRNRSLHLMGLLSDGQVHSSQEHLYALLQLAKQHELARVYIHGFLDGRDTPPSSAVEYVTALQNKIEEIGCGRIASLVGRYFAMDRDKRWDRTERAYHLLVNGSGNPTPDPVAGIRKCYAEGITDEFIPPLIVVDSYHQAVATIQDGDAAIFFNFRPDRARQLTRALAVSGFNEFPIPDRPKIDFVCFSVYDITFDLPVAFPPQRYTNVLAEVWGGACTHNYRLAETEKYAHVTYFFNGGIETPYNCERRLLVPSPKIATYDLQPAMSAFEVTGNVLRGIKEDQTDVFVINFANPDMVGHTGKLDKTIEACQYVDTCLGSITEAIRHAGGTTIITADHGNAEQMIDPKTGGPHTAHTTNPVPFHLVDDRFRGVSLRSDGALEDVAPTMLELLGLEKPAEMTGNDLLNLEG